MPAGIINDVLLIINDGSQNIGVELLIYYILDYTRTIFNDAHCIDAM